MLATHTRIGSRCIYCAFRNQLFLHQARRHKSTGFATTKHFRFGRDSDRPKSRFADDDTSRSSRGKDRDGKAAWTTEEGVNIRKHRVGKVKENYNNVLHKKLQSLREELKESPVLEQLRREEQDDGEKSESFTKVWKAFRQKFVPDSDTKEHPWSDDWRAKDAQAELREIYRQRGERGLEERIKYAFYGHVTGARFTESDIRNQKTLADLRYPTEWYPATRSMHRTIHLHVGPTNSGKTYHALQRLEASESGCYAGPLRLLAHEVYSRMNAKGRPCSLMTGEERRTAEEAIGGTASGVAGTPGLQACTVEMMPLNKTLDVAVIDEIQMIGNAERGWAWTQALLGVKAREVHLCGEDRTVPLIQELCASVGEKLEIHRYERLSPLKVAETSLDGDLKKLRKGDCIVSFSVMGIHALRRQIEKQTGRKVATVYGSLPPETRAQQARLFNDPTNEYDYLVASDAVGMGLNLAIKRIIFEASSKFDGTQRRTLGVADIKQIAGRAGRYRTAEQASQTPEQNQDLAAAKGDSPTETMTGGEVTSEKENLGLVTTLEEFDFPIVSAAMTAQPEPIRTAGLFPPSSVLERFASYFPPGTPFSYILTRLHELSQMHNRFHLCGLKEQIWIADLIEPVKGLTISDRNTICSAPCSKSETDMFKTLMPAYARCIAEQTTGNIVDIEELPLEVLEAPVSASREYLRELERLHKGIVTYLWLSYRFAGVFTTRALAFHVKAMVEAKIEEVLSQFSFSETSRRKMAEARQKAVMKDMLDTASVGQAGEAIATGTSQGVPDLDAEGEADEDTPDEGLERQTTLTAGGDRFGGEEDLSWEDPAIMGSEEDLVQGESTASTSFAQWRAQQVKGESQGSEEPGDEQTISQVFRTEEENVTEAAVNGKVDEAGEGRPAITDVLPEAAAEEASQAFSEDAAASSPEQSTSSLETPVTPETELDSDRPPLETQVAPSRANREVSNGG
ncbi:P-loop containing nucleoside triphosphate hydrolase protein [Hortaea werneckii]|nr:P-loop containing nucleoside triphosphate hydrolase protein [Hortaea werneckii]